MTTRLETISVFELHDQMRAYASDVEMLRLALLDESKYRNAYELAIRGRIIAERRVEIRRRHHDQILAGLAIPPTSLPETIVSNVIESTRAIVVRESAEADPLPLEELSGTPRNTEE